MAILANPKHEAVALAYLADPHKIGWRAYKAIYPKSSKHAAETAFGRLLKNAEFSARVAETHERAAQGVVMSATEVLEELSKIGRSNMADYDEFMRDGDLSKLTRDQAAVVHGLEISRVELAGGETDEALEPQGNGGALKRRKKNGSAAVVKVKFKLTPKTPALDLLGKHHKLFVDRVEHSFTGGLAERLSAALARVDGKKPKKDPDAEKRPDHDPPGRRRGRTAKRKGKRARA